MATTNIYYTNFFQEPAIDSAAALLDHVTRDHMKKHNAVCVIENISEEYIKYLTADNFIDPNFFSEHKRCISRKKFWARSNDWDGNSYLPTTGHIDGMFEYHELECRNPSDLNSGPNFIKRECFKEDRYGIQSHTRISYCLINDSTYLFLVDAPLQLRNCKRPQGSRARTSLRLRYSTSRGGILLPQLFKQQEYSLLNMFKSVLEHGWHLRFLFSYPPDQPSLLAPHLLLYLISSSLWETNFRFLNDEIKRISFRDLRDPKMSTNDELHNYREDLFYLKDHITNTINWFPKDLAETFGKIDAPQELATLGNPEANLRRILDDTEKLGLFLMDSFQILSSSLSVRDSMASVIQGKLAIDQALVANAQARRSAWLTQLATLYLPLSVATGVFGMNIKPINGATPPFWWPIAFLVILGGSTWVAWWIGIRVNEFRKYRDRKVVQPSITIPSP